MKKNLVCLSVLAGLMSFPTLAELSEESGFGGKIALLTGVMSSESNFNMDTKTKNGPLNSAGSSESEFLTAPLGELTYTFGSNNDQQIFFGTSESDVAVGDFALELGYAKEFESGMVVSASYLPSIIGGETWEDPYLTGTERKATDITGNAYRLQLDGIMGSDFSADLGYYTSEVDNDLLAAQDKDLARDGNGIYTSFSYDHFLSETSMLSPAIIYKSFSADGKAMSNTGYGLELSYQRVMGNHALSVSAEYMNTSYDAANSKLGNVKRKDNSYGIFAAYEYKDVMGWENWNAVSLLGYDVQSSNIAFYDEKEYLVSVGVSYEF